MSQVLIREKNLSATVANLIISNTAEYSDLSRGEATKKLTARISQILQQTIEHYGEQKTFDPGSFWYIWQGIYCTFSAVSNVHGAIEKLPSVEAKDCDFVIANLYTALS